MDLSFLSRLAAILTEDPAVPGAEARAPAPPEDVAGAKPDADADGDGVSDALEAGIGLAAAGAGSRVVPRDPAAVGADTRGQPVPPEAVEMVARFEGFRSRPYRCSKGQATQGYGRAFWPDGRPVRMSDRPVSEATAREWLAEDLARFAEVVDEAVTVPINAGERSALISFAFNVGEGAFRGSTLVEELNRGRRNRAALEFGKWARSGGRLLSALIKRRAAEAALFVGTRLAP